MRRRRSRTDPRVMPWSWHQAMRAYWDADLARRVALPARLPDVDRPPVVITIQCGERCDVLTVSEPARRCRCDQGDLTVNGEDRGLTNRTAVGRLVADMMPRWPSKRLQAEADRIYEDTL